MPMTAPLVSICIPTYNYRRFLPDALESALAQSMRDIEVIVVDNHSDDGTMDLLGEFARRDARVMPHRNETNVGMTANFNRCLELARGKYVKLLCADDVLTADCVEQLVAAMEERSDTRLAGCARYYFREPGKPMRTTAYASSRRSVPGSAVVRECFFAGNLVGEPTAVMFRRSDAGQGFDAQYSQAFDMEFWFRLLTDGWFTFLPEALCGVREHERSGTADNLRSGRVTQDKVRLFAEYAGRPYLGGTLMERLRWDGRMASSVAREVAAGSLRDGAEVLGAVYYPTLFSIATLPLARAFAAVRY
jgi:glycosyltransferase involved in cell wall biosynthesis